MNSEEPKKRTHRQSRAGRGADKKKEAKKKVKIANFAHYDVIKFENNVLNSQNYFIYHDVIILLALTFFVNNLRNKLIMTS